MSYCRKYNLSQATEAMINNQINIELSASHTYLALYSFFMNDKQSFQGFAKYFKYCSEEEMIHANKFIDYQKNQYLVLSFLRDTSTLHRMKKNNIKRGWSIIKIIIFRRL